MIHHARSCRLKAPLASACVMHIVWASVSTTRARHRVLRVDRLLLTACSISRAVGLLTQPLHEPAISPSSAWQGSPGLRFCALSFRTSANTDVVGNCSSGRRSRGALGVSSASRRRLSRSIHALRVSAPCDGRSGVMGPFIVRDRRDRHLCCGRSELAGCTPACAAGRGRVGVPPEDDTGHWCTLRARGAGVRRLYDRPLAMGVPTPLGHGERTLGVLSGQPSPSVPMRECTASP